MVKTTTLDDSDVGEGKVLPDLSNEFNEALCQSFVKDYEMTQGIIDKIMENARVACQPHVDRMKDIAKEAAECGIEKKAFKAKLRERGYKRRASTVRNTLSERQREVYDKMTAMLPDDELFAYTGEGEGSEE
jgi:hypothetical protein